MANTLRGRVLQVRPTQTGKTKAGNDFSRRELILDCTRYDQLTGEKGYDNTPCISFTQDKCALLDALQPGMIVEVSVDITGRYYEPKDAYFNDVRGYKVEVLRQQPQAQAQQPQAQTQTYPQHPYMAPQQPVQQAYPQPQYPQYPPQAPYAAQPPQDPNQGLPF